MAHIPSGTTADMELVTFQQALKAANTPSEEYDIVKWLYAPNFYSEYRYVYFQGGLTFEHGRLAIMAAAEKVGAK